MTCSAYTINHAVTVRRVAYLRKRPHFIVTFASQNLGLELVCTSTIMPASRRLCWHFSTWWGKECFTVHVINCAGQMMDTYYTSTYMLEGKAWYGFQFAAFQIAVPVEFFLGICVCGRKNQDILVVRDDKTGKR